MKITIHQKKPVILDSFREKTELTTKKGRKMIDPSTTIRIKELARLWEKYGNLISASNVQNGHGKAKAAYRKAAEYIGQVIDEEEELLLKKVKK